MDTQAHSHAVDLDSPPLFSPHVFIAERKEKSTFGASGYMIKLCRFMLLDYDATTPILLLAKKFNINPTWKRTLRIYVQEARDLSPQMDLSVHDVRCKLVVGAEVQRTRIVRYDKDLTAFWDETFQFSVEQPCTINVLAYSKNKLIPNDKLGRICIAPSALVEGSTVIEWFPFHTKGELKMSITLNPPTLAPFKFTCSNTNNSTPAVTKEWRVIDCANEKVLEISGQWPHHQSFINCCTKTEAITIQNIIYQTYEKQFEIKSTSGNHSRIAISQYARNEFKVEGISSIDFVEYNEKEFKMYNKSHFCVAFSNHRSRTDFKFVIRPGQDMIVVLAVMFVISRLRSSYVMR